MMNYDHDIFESSKNLDRNSPFYNYPYPADNLVYNHLQQTLQVQTDLKNQRLQEFCTEVPAIINEFDPFQCAGTDATDLTHPPYAFLTTPFYGMDTTPTTASSNSSFNPPSGIAAGLDTSYFPQEQFLCQPLDSFQDLCFMDPIHCDYPVNTHPSMASNLNCQSIDYPPFIPPFLSAQEQRNRSTPLLSTSFSFSSMSSASSIENEEEDLVLSENTITNLKKINSMTNSRKQPSKSVSMSCLPEYSSQRQKRKQKHHNQQRQKPVSSYSLDNNSNLPYYMSHHHLLSDIESDREQEQEKKMVGKSSSSNSIGKKGRNVDKACNHCKRSHLRCDNVRPCRRCVATGKIGCQDVKHKPRGRPRLQKKMLIN
ncbi:hypothetical protein A0J61_02791 [Choanephora cucurbitarum]|uniref:Zn(2)-C6 fungal-type domain-containing protein n=1 Tax=Choanephora cucurbitarum TaxID=101091 RepID=A0A1C7NJ72_9FUNG|nr:hypothetical protein A0J61_02791 [Choanephora cucurbitarum]